MEQSLTEKSHLAVIIIEAKQSSKPTETHAPIETTVTTTLLPEIFIIVKSPAQHNFYLLGELKKIIYQNSSPIGY